MVQSLMQSASKDLRQLLEPLSRLARACPQLKADVAGGFENEGRTYEIPRFVFSGAVAGQPKFRLGLFGGLHGDEPASSVALINFLHELAAAPERAANFELVVYPVTNPTGCEDGTRHNRAGKDLNREFWRNSDEPEVRILEAELREHRFDGIVALHADDTCSGLYGYAHDRLLNEALLRPALAASERILPRDGRVTIDGFTANDGIIHQCFCGVLSAPPDQRPQPFDIIFETPALEPLDVQAQAAAVALQTILDEYRGFIAQGQDL